MKRTRNEKQKVIITALLCIALLLSSFTRANAQYQSYEKTDLKITSAMDYLSFVNSVNSGNDYSGKIIRLTKDIDFTGMDFSLIKDNFAGTFDGCGHVLSGISYTGDGGALFGDLYGTLQNLTVRDSSFEYKNSTHVAVFATINRGLIDNCSTYANVIIMYDSTTRCAGVAGTNLGSIINCMNAGNITTKYSSAGIANYNSGIILNCYNQGIINSGRPTYNGGIAYYNEGEITNCYNSGSAKNGIVYQSMSSGKIKSCYFLLDASTSGVGTGNYTAADVKAMMQYEMMSEDFIAVLNTGIKYKVKAINWEMGTLFPSLVAMHEVTFEKDYSTGSMGTDLSYAQEGTTVAITAKPKENYYAKSISVNTEEGIAIDTSGNDNNISFRMPDNNVVVSAVFAKLEAPKGITLQNKDKTIKWSKVEDADGYEIYQSSNGKNNFKLLKSTAELKYTDSKSSKSTASYYKVRAYVLVDGDKIYSSFSKVVH